MKQYRWVFLMFLAAVAIHIQESLYRLKFFDSFFSLKTQICLQPIYFIAGWSLFWGFRKAQSFLSAWAVFIFFIVISRTLINFYVGEPWNAAVVMGLVFMVYGLFLTFQRDNDPRLISVGTAMLLLGTAYAYRLWPKGLFAKLEVSWWMLYLFIAAAGIAAFEYMSRRGFFEKYFTLKTQAAMIPLNLVIDGCLFYGYREAKPSFIFAWAVYTVYDVILRVGNNKLLGEPFKETHALGMAVVIVGTALAYLGGLG